ncbi:hypothetical protein N2601_29700 (plasmid) [Rhizobium sp. CB3060]|uniref:hypothetical protein n=1 Tax=Rhizobium sp. CB3060 TaxID=3138255 RepID=UPI0021A8EE36|nr:hypothetical protein [Rhizobium tropici]UWU25631.1 hypothetical protein N2601_29700 [Rhizobium tropici]
MNQQLQAVDLEFATAPGARLVTKLALKDGGVDPLGLRQINLDLMDRAIPGINNTTVFIRPYAFMAWAWWKTNELLSKGGKQDIDAAAAKNFVMRLEVIYAWSHMLNGGRDLPGMAVLRSCLPLEGGRPFTFKGADWETVKKKRQASTSIMDAIQYGPSIKALGFLEQTSVTGVFRPTEQAMPAVRAIDAIVAGSTMRLMVDPKVETFRPEEVKQLNADLPPSEPTGEERDVFRKLFEPGRETGRKDFTRRHETLALVLEAIDASPSGLTVPELRGVLASGVLPSGRRLLRAGSNETGLQTTWLLMSSLQVRQLQRLALESMLVWIEVMIKTNGGSASTDALVAMALSQAVVFDSDLAGPTVGDVLAAMSQRSGDHGWPVAAAKGQTDFVALSDRLSLAQRGGPGSYEAIPGLCLTALAYVQAMYTALKLQGADDGRLGELGGRSDRFPTSLQHRRLLSLQDATVDTLWRELIETWVIGQHVRWSVARNGDGTQRLRLALGDSGWLRVHKRLSGPFGPTPDRLLSALSLAAQSGMVNRKDTSVEVRFLKGRAGDAR